MAERLIVLSADGLKRSPEDPPPQLPKTACLLCFDVVFQIPGVCVMTQGCFEEFSQQISSLSFCEAPNSPLRFLLSAF